MSGYEYGNTRLRAMRSRLLRRSDYLDMMAAGSLDRMLAALGDTPYADDVESALVRARGLDRLDRALRANLASTLRKMASFYEGRPRELVGLLVNRWDLRNLRTLLRLIGIGDPRIDPAGLLVPAGRLEESELAELASQDSIASLVDLIVSWGIPSPDSAFALLRARAEYMAEGDLSHLEQVIDRTFSLEAERILANEDDDGASIIRAEIDARNLMLALRVRAARIDGEPGWTEATDRYLSGGLRTVDYWKQIADTDSPEAVVELVGARSPVPGWSDAVVAWVRGDDLTELNDALQRAISSAARARFTSGDQLGFDIPVAYTFAKEAEVRNLSLVGRGLVHRLPMSEVEAGLEVAA